MRRGDETGSGPEGEARASERKREFCVLRFDRRGVSGINFRRSADWVDNSRDSTAPRVPPPRFPLRFPPSLPPSALSAWNSSGALAKQLNCNVGRRGGNTRVKYTSYLSSQPSRRTRTRLRDGAEKGRKKREGGKVESLLRRSRNAIKSARVKWDYAAASIRLIRRR